MTAFSTIRVSPDDITVPVTCEMPECPNTGLQRVFIAGHPAGYLCVPCARNWAKLWAELTNGTAAKVRNRAILRDKVAA